ncbi:hypothetical protein FHX42_005064 [Saccharopolyspora lacisalsi]|uniref:Uncharacterized protein n=1 Tax=Halosaccharopolyspora lacisalsi TaxID=1000566 RepID=A0A839E3L6_9PSEU|nr:hypothetical protein [Halosaccharopolyspora lacisalsi]MBA8827640.1 hypothetical protein [Halosaccharopolyspora lacisalsi]MBA8827659.1 hypothetical protein [Halosaccharopolyspora lacisalsi]
MDEQTLRAGMRDALDDEPPLGLEPDRIADEARRAQRRRRATFGTGVATLAVLAGAATIPAVTGPHHREVIPAAPSVVTDVPTEGAVPPKLSQDELDQRRRMLENHAAKAVRRVAPKLDDVSLEHSGLIGIGAPRPRMPRKLNMSVGFTDSTGPTAVSVEVGTAGTFDKAPSESCDDTLTCEVVNRPDRSVLVRDAVLVGPRSAVTESVSHYRTDGTVVRVTAFTYDPATPSADEVRENPALSEEQLTGLATDPKFTLGK